MYRLGHGVTQNFTEAMKWYRKAADQGNANAQAMVGMMYEKARGVPESFTKALKWYRMAADQAMPWGIGLGAMYSLPWRYADSTEWLKWYRKAADQGNIAAELQLDLAEFDFQGTRILGPVGRRRRCSALVARSEGHQSESA